MKDVSRLVAFKHVGCIKRVVETERDLKTEYIKLSEGSSFQSTLRADDQTLVTVNEDDFQSNVTELNQILIR